MFVLSDKARRELSLTCLFGTFVFLQFTVLGLANHAGEGYLSTEQRNLVYYALQVFVICGFLLHGDTPVFQGETPKKAADVKYTYVFKGWMPAIARVTADVTYTAMYDEAVVAGMTRGSPHLWLSCCA